MPSKTHVWNPVAGNSGATVRTEPLRPHVFRAVLMLIHNGQGIDIPGAVQPNGAIAFALTSAQVALIRTDQAELQLSTIHVRRPGAGNQWGWRYKVEQGQQRLRASDLDGASVRLDADGYYRSGLETIDTSFKRSKQKIDFA